MNPSTPPPPPPPPPPRLRACSHQHIYPVHVFIMVQFVLLITNGNHTLTSCMLMDADGDIASFPGGLGTRLMVILFVPLRSLARLRIVLILLRPVKVKMTTRVENCSLW